ncbi:MAG: hypothetical protein ACXITV_00940 [Luteibaculaceae bacterium]
MKNLFLSIFTVALFSTAAFSQGTPCCTTTVVEKIEFNKEVLDILKVSVQYSDTKLIKDSWLSYVKKESKSKGVDLGNGYTKFEGSKVQGLGKERVEIISYFVEAPTGVNIFTAFYFDSVYVDPANEGFALEAAKTFLNRFSVSVQKSIYENELNRAEAKQKGYESNLKDANREVTKVKKNIQKEENKITNLRQDIERNENEQSLSLTQIKSKREEMIVLPREAKNQRKILQKDVNGYERDIKKLRRANEKNQSRIKSVESDIQKLRVELNKAEKEVEYKSEVVSKQNSEIIALKEKIKGLKK